MCLELTIELVYYYVDYLFIVSKVGKILGSLEQIV